MSADNERVLVITRVFKGPRHLIFNAWADPAQSRQWMGPRGFTATEVTQDARPGGIWRLCLRADDGSRELWQGGVFREITPPERLVFTFAWDDAAGCPGHEMLVTVTFAEREDGTTLMTFRQELFDTIENRDGHRDGWDSTFDRLADHLAAIQGRHAG
ncbi:SRPBCC domain-containing protein [Dongia soli]|uniref:SRPBCC domain-containing protein n=1 Tax=Dongia soli TaxID=600628 RepID=A0ABU5EGC4_9PROT|nr:SRPBCC domain-containing protein [Dongia soli]MDY0884493.1 SRPBCC domain-containing protein [Dongia soli]